MTAQEDKDNFPEAVKLLTEKLGGTPLAKVAAHALAFGWQQGYYEYIENEAVAEILQPLSCKWCGRLHYCQKHEDLHQKT